MKQSDILVLSMLSERLTAQTTHNLSRRSSYGLKQYKMTKNAFSSERPRGPVDFQ